MGPEGYILFLALASLSLALFGAAVRKRRLSLNLGRPVEKFGDHGARVKWLLVDVLAQRKVLWEPYPGIMHLFIFWGFLVLAPGEIQFFGEGLFPGFSIPLLGKNPYFYLLQDVFCLLVLIGLGMAFHRRYIARLDRLDRDAESLLIISLIAAVMVTLLLGGAARAAINPEEYLLMTPVVRPLGIVLAGSSSPGLLSVVYYFFWWLHVLAIMAFMAFIPRSKHLHLMAAPFNVYFRSLESPGAAVRPIDFADPDLGALGANKIEDFSRKHLLDLYSCTKCGRCQDNCPSHLSGKPLSPKVFINKLKEHFIAEGDYLFSRGNPAGACRPPEELGADGSGVRQLAGDVLSRDDIWPCTTCGACQYICPVYIEHVPKRIELRRYQVMERAEYPAGLQEAVRCLESRHHPYRGAKMSRGDWYKDLEISEMEKGKSVEVLYWVGCTTALDERITKVARAFTGLMQRAEVSFGLLGNKEACCGDPARRIGNEYLYETIAKANIDLLNNYGVKTIVTNCPHCYNTFKNEYPQFGGSYEVLHHSKYLFDLIRQGRLNPDGGKPDRITYHDPCYLGRYNEEFDAPRQLLYRLTGSFPVEMERSRGRSFCCGGGGGGSWVEEEGNRINRLRALQAMETGADVLCTACPFCMTMMEDGVKAVDAEGGGRQMKIKDLAELLFESYK